MGIAKFVIPQTLVSLIDRPRVARQMADFATRKCTVLHAPPGGGKTTFLAQWIGAAGIPEKLVYWITLDEEDARPDKFLNTLAAAANLEDVALDLMPMAAQARASANKLWSKILERGDMGVLILDDYQVAESEDLNALLAVLLERLPPSLHVVISGTSLPAIPLGRLRSQGQVLVIGPTELAFDDAEGRALLSSHVPDNDIQRLSRGLAGWPAFLQLVVINSTSTFRSVEVSDAIDNAWSDIASFIETEIFEPLPPDTRALLIETSVARTLSLDLSIAICGDKISGDGFRKLVRSFPTIPVSTGQTTTFRHHPVIARYLQERLAALGSATGLTYHRRAADWFHQQGNVSEAAFHMAAIGDTDAIATLIEKRGAVRIALVNGFPELVNLIELLPAETILARPRLRLAQAWVSAKRGNVVAARQWSQAVHSVAAALPIDDTIKRETLFVEKMMWAVYEEHSIGPDALQEIEDIRTIVPDDDPWFASWVNNLLCVMHTRRGNLLAADEAADRALNSYRMADALYGEVFARGHQAMISVMSGRFSDATVQAEIAAKITSAHFAADAGLSAMIDFLRGHIAYERNEFGQARALLTPALEKIELAETWVELHALGAASLAKILFEEGAHEKAYACLDKMYRVGGERGLMRLQWLAAHCRFELLLGAGKPGEAAQVALQHDIPLKGNCPFATWFEGERSTLAGMHIDLANHHQLDSLQERLEDFIEEAESLGHRRASVEALILLTRLFHDIQRQDDAKATLQKALAIAVPEMMLRAFLENGSPIVPVLKTMIRSVGIKSLQPATLSFIIRVMSDAGGVPTGNAGATTMFSDKELEVLGNLVSDYSNKMIARRLAISEATVKFHLANIYRKLGVNTRTDAKSIARERHLVSL